MATKIYQCMQKISDAIVENKDFLTDLDREIGDADHGVNMARGFTEVIDRKSTRLNSSHIEESRMPSSA